MAGNSEALLATEAECPETWLARRLAAGKPAESWKPVPGWYYEQVGLPVPAVPHQVSDQGRTKSPHGKILADKRSNQPEDNPPDRRYRLVNLCSGGLKKTVTVHSLVLICHGDAEHPPGPRPEGMHASHENDHPAHNWTENLRWRPPDGPGGNEQRKAPEVRKAAAVAGRAAQAAAGTAVPPRPTFECVNHARCGGYALNAGRRCGGCVAQVGKDAALLLAAGMPLQAVGEFFGHTDGRWVFEQAARHGGWTGTQAEARTQRPGLRQRVRLVWLKRQIRGRHPSCRVRQSEAGGDGS